MHNFREDLAYSETASDAAFWDAVYRKAFPNLSNHMICSGQCAAQHMGIDRILILSNGKVLTVDEKKRRTEYTDILLEYVSMDTTNAPGWMEKDLAIDYLAYAFMPSQRVYLFAWPMLRRAWLHFGATWRAQYRTIRASNANYTTLSVAVPTKVLLAQVRNASIIQL